MDRIDRAEHVAGNIQSVAGAIDDDRLAIGKLS
jgi:hypothetical protein